MNYLTKQKMTMREIASLFNIGDMKSWLNKLGKRWQRCRGPDLSVIVLAV